LVKYVAETTLKKSLMKLGISKYKLIEELPEYLVSCMSHWPASDVACAFPHHSILDKRR